MVKTVMGRPWKQGLTTDESLNIPGRHNRSRALYGSPKKPWGRKTKMSRMIE